MRREFLCAGICSDSGLDWIGLLVALADAGGADG